MVCLHMPQQPGPVLPHRANPSQLRQRRYRDTGEGIGPKLDHCRDGSLNGPTVAKNRASSSSPTTSPLSSAAVASRNQAHRTFSHLSRISPRTRSSPFSRVASTSSLEDALVQFQGHVRVGMEDNTSYRKVKSIEGNAASSSAPPESSTRRSGNSPRPRIQRTLRHDDAVRDNQCPTIPWMREC